MPNNLRSSEGYPNRKQPGVNPSNINDSNGLRSRYTNRTNGVNEQQQPANGHQRNVNGCSVNGHQNAFNGHSNFANGHPNIVNGHISNSHGPSNGHETPINGHSNSVNEHSVVNGHVAKVNGHRNIANGCQNGLYINKMVANGFVGQRDDSSKQSGFGNGLKNNSNDRTKGTGPSKENGVTEKNRQIGVDGKNGINRTVVGQNAVGGRVGVRKELGKDTFGIPGDLRQLLRPTVVQKRQEIIKVDYDPEDINGPYNFRQFLRPAEYLPTESLRKRKGGLASNGVAVSKDRIPEKHVKRRAPLAPNQNKLVNVKK